MKTVVIAIATTMLGAVVDAASCNLIKLFALVKPLETNANAQACIKATGYQLLPPAGPPTKDQLDKICACQSCVNVFTTLHKLNLPDCTVDILGGINMRKIMDDAAAQCKSRPKETHAPAPPVPVTTPPPAPVTTAPPVPVTTSPPVPGTTAPPVPVTTAPASPVVIITTETSPQPSPQPTPVPVPAPVPVPTPQPSTPSTPAGLPPAPLPTPSSTTPCPTAASKMVNSKAMCVDEHHNDIKQQDV